MRRSTPEAKTPFSRKLIMSENQRTCVRAMYQVKLQKADVFAAELQTHQLLFI